MTAGEVRGIMRVRFENTMTQRNAIHPMFYSPVITAMAVWRKAGFVCLRHTGRGLKGGSS